MVGMHIICKCPINDCTGINQNGNFILSQQVLPLEINFILSQTKGRNMDNLTSISNIIESKSFKYCYDKIRLLTLLLRIWAIPRN